MNALKNINIEIEKSRRASPRRSGSGKTTLILELLDRVGLLKRKKQQARPDVGRRTAKSCNSYCIGKRSEITVEEQALRS